MEESTLCDEMQYLPNTVTQLAELVVGHVDVRPLYQMDCFGEFNLSSYIEERFVLFCHYKRLICKNG